MLVGLEANRTKNLAEQLLFVIETPLITSKCQKVDISQVHKVYVLCEMIYADVGAPSPNVGFPKF